jgi:hypothetical protein
MRNKHILDRINRYIDDIEQYINAMMLGVNPEEMAPEDRVNFAIKFMALYPNFYALKKSYEMCVVPDTREETLLSIWMRQMRGEVEEDGP